VKAELLDQSVALKFSLDTRLESECFEPLIDFLAFLVDLKQTNQLIFLVTGLINYLIFFIDHNFGTQNPSRSSKLSKGSDFSMVSKKNSSKILPSIGLVPGPDKVG